jgi:hypothetical protein
MHTRVHAYARAYACVCARVHVHVGSHDLLTLLPLPAADAEVSLGLQVASSLLLVHALLPCPLFSNPPSHCPTTGLEQHPPVQAVCAPRGPSRPLPVHTSKLII